MDTNAQRLGQIYAPPEEERAARGRDLISNANSQLRVSVGRQVALSQPQRDASAGVDRQDSVQRTPPRVWIPVISTVRTDKNTKTGGHNDHNNLQDHVLQG